NIFPIYKKLRYIVKKDDLLKPSSIFTNQLKIFIQDNKLTKPNQAWSTDFTYLPYRYSFLYLSTVIDTYTKEILGFHISKRHTTEMTLAALKMATSGRGHPMIHHSDQGSEYKAESYQQYLQDNNIICSMSKKSSPWENGYQESFYGKYRYELGNLNRFKTEIEAIEAIILQLHYYNNKRIHTTIRDTPVLFRQKELKRLRLEEETKVSSFSRAGQLD
ncbi:IS3 family transposase, partial [Candidatus Gracilibacteria bacterium]|nr:IS3 family transposase [Candidatus Gracilibacteria bacterium]